MVLSIKTKIRTKNYVHIRNVSHSESPLLHRQPSFSRFSQFVRSGLYLIIFARPKSVIQVANKNKNISQDKIVGHRFFENRLKYYTKSYYTL